MIDEVQMALDVNPQLLQALYSQSNASSNDGVQTLLSHADGSEASGPGIGIDELLGQLESTNPTASLIARYLMTNQRLADTSGSQAHTKSERSYEAEQSEKLTRLLGRLEEIRQLRLEVKQLQEKNDALADSLGACYLCWGEDPGCPICRGTGAPGFMMPDKQLFMQWVAPALQRLQAQKEANQTVSTSSNQKGPPNLELNKGEKNE
jgi:hypothetical protein